MNNSLGLVEINGFCSSISTVDAILKNSSVKISLEEVFNGNVLLKLKGTLPQINYAINLAIENANKNSSVVNYSVLGKVNPEIENAFFVREKISSRKKQSAEITLAETIKQTLTADKQNEKVLVKSTTNKKKRKSVDSESLSKKTEIKQPTSIEPKSSTIERLKLEALGKKALKDAEKIFHKTETTKTYDIKKISDLDGLNVHKLRRAARDFEEFPIKGRQISMASRDELMDYFKQILSE